MCTDSGEREQAGVYHRIVLTLTSRSMRSLLGQLVRAYGPREARVRGDSVSVLVGTILSQNTSNRNSAAGYKQLRRRFRSWKQVADAPVDQVERCIRVCGLSNLKAPRLQSILRQIRSERGRIDLQFLADLPPDQATAYLTRFGGIGPKTAACVLLFAFGRSVFPVDTHIHRIARRLGLVGDRATAVQAQQALEPLIRPADRYAMHILLIAHGRQTCRAIGPRCDECVLRPRCAYARTKAQRARRDARDHRSTVGAVAGRRAAASSISRVSSMSSAVPA